MRAVNIGVDQADRNALDAAAVQHLEFRTGLGLVQREEHPAVRGTAFPDPAT